MSAYRLWIGDAAKREGRELPGHMRQRTQQHISALADNPRPPASRPLRNPAGIEGLELRRLRLGPWRVVYAIDEGDRSVGVYAIRRRPPYDYGDLTSLLEDG